MSFMTLQCDVASSQLFRLQLTAIAAVNPFDSINCFVAFIFILSMCVFYVRPAITIPLDCGRKEFNTCLNYMSFLFLVPVL